MRVLGISAFYHDSAAALIEDGRIAAAAQEERFSRKKHDSAFPKSAVSYCLEAAGCGFDGIDYVVLSNRKPEVLEQLVERISPEVVREASLPNTSLGGMRFEQAAIEVRNRAKLRSLIAKLGWRIQHYKKEWVQDRSMKAASPCQRRIELVSQVIVPPVEPSFGLNEVEEKDSREA